MRFQIWWKVSIALTMLIYNFRVNFLWMKAASKGKKFFCPYHFFIIQSSEAHISSYLFSSMLDVKFGWRGWRGDTLFLLLFHSRWLDFEGLQDSFFTQNEILFRRKRAANFSSFFLLLFFFFVAICGKIGWECLKCRFFFLPFSSWPLNSPKW